MPDEPYVLVVDDERIIADTLRMILKSRGFSAVTAYSGEEALAYALLHPPHMLISDVIMPGMTGFDLAIQLKDRFDCTVLLISGQVATTPLLEQAARAGYAFDLLAKPADPKEILERVQRAFPPPNAARRDVRN
jgi:CheY-like chemotaxis protein